VWCHTCWGNPAQQRIFRDVQSYQPTLESLNQVDADALTFETCSSGTGDLEAIGRIVTDKRRLPISTSGAGPSSCSSAGSADPQDPALSRHLGKCCAHPDRRRADRLSLLRLAQAAQHTIQSPLAFARLIRTNLMHRRRLDRLLETEPADFNPCQLALQWTQS